MNTWDCECGSRNFSKHKSCWKCYRDRPRLTTDEKMEKAENLRKAIGKADSLGKELREEYKILTGFAF